MEEAKSTREARERAERMRHVRELKSGGWKSLADLALVAEQRLKVKSTQEMRSNPSDFVETALRRHDEAYRAANIRKIGLYTLMSPALVDELMVGIKKFIEDKRLMKKMKGSL